MSDPETAPDRPNRWPWAPILYLVVGVAAYVMKALAPLPPLLPRPLDRWIGWPLALLGVGLAVVALRHMHASGTSFHPTEPATALTETGLYRRSRNPMYLGVHITFLGLGLATRWTWLIILDAFLPFALYWFAIKPEEAYLERRFGDAYRAYKARVRRWI